MRLPFIGKIDIGYLSSEDGENRMLGTYVVPAILLLLGFAIGLGVHFISSYRDDDETFRYLRSVDAPDSELVTAVKHAAETGCTDDTESTECELNWLLVRELINREKFSSIETLTEKLFPPKVQVTPEWARRMLQLAHAFVKNDEWDRAQAYYSAAQESFQNLNLPTEYASVVRERAGLLCAGSGGTREARLAALRHMLTQLPAQGTRDLANELRIFIAELQISPGTHVQAQESLRTILAEVAEHPETPPATLRACLGYAHLALNEDEEAIECLRRGLQGLSGTDNASRVYCALALRDLATVALNLGRIQEVLALSERVDATVGPVIPPSSLFRVEITGKRAQALYMAHDYDYSLRICQRQLEMIPAAEEGLRAMPLEGMAWSYLALGQPEQALRVAQECCALRERNFAEDKIGLGRVYLLYAQAQDQGGHPSTAEEFYGKAAALLPDGHPYRTDALEGQASALTQEKRWSEAIGVWEQLLSLVPEGDEINREHIESEIKQCRSQLQHPGAQTTQAIPTRTAVSHPDTRKSSPRSTKRNTHRRTQRRRRNRS